MAFQQEINRMSKAIRLETYLANLGENIKEKADTAKQNEMDDYEMGYKMALYEVISLMCQQAEVFDIGLEDIGLEGVDPERDYL